MTGAELYALLADAILVLHFGVVLFVISGLLAGMAHLLWSRPRWAGRPGFVLLHVVVVLIVVLQSWLGVICPLTTWESRLRRMAGQPVYEESFVQHWLHRLLFYQAEPWVFGVVYTVFGVAVLAVWLTVLRRRRRSTRP